MGDSKQALFSHGNTIDLLADKRTKAAIFDKWAPQDPNFANANAATQSAIRAKFGVAAPVAAEPSTYSKVRDFVTPTVEALGAVGGGAAGALGGPLGAVAGPGWWVDMESKLRDAHDWFSLERCADVLAKARPFIGESLDALTSPKATP